MPSRSFPGPGQLAFMLCRPAVTGSMVQVGGKWHLCPGKHFQLPGCSQHALGTGVRFGHSKQPSCVLQQDGQWVEIKFPMKDHQPLSNLSLTG